MRTKSILAIFSAILCIGMAIMVAACEKEDNSKIQILEIEIESNEIEGKGIATVKMVIEACKHSEGIGGISNVFASVEYKNGDLRLKLPAIPDEYLGEYFWYDSPNIIPEGVVISVSNVKVGYMYLIARNSKGNQIGSFDFTDDNLSRWDASHIYANKDFTIKGTSKNGKVFDCSFKKGWNIIYSKNFGFEFTNHKPLNGNFKWRYWKDQIYDF